MALIQFEFKSETLRLATQINIVFSQKIREQFGRGHRSPVLYLLHGLSDDHSAWIRKTSIERYAEAYDLIIVMPSVHRSFYRNTHSGYRYFDYIAEELPSLCTHYFPISENPHETFVAGISMGGYGAFKLALSHPERYRAAASLSGALDLAVMVDRRDEMLPEWPHIFGPTEQLAAQDDLLELAKSCINGKKRIPNLYQCCGTEDYLYPCNQSFLAHANTLELGIEYHEGPGEHEWGYWDKKIQDVLAWLPLPKLD